MKITEELSKRTKPAAGAIGQYARAGAGRMRSAAGHVKSAAVHMKYRMLRAFRKAAGAAAGIPKEKRMLALGIAAGLVVGAAAVGTFSGYREEQMQEEYEAKATQLEGDIAALTESSQTLRSENEKLRLEADDNELAHNNAEILAGDSDEWMLVLVNEEHPLETTYEPAQLTQIDAERSVDSRIAADLQQMMSDGAAQGLNMYVTSAYRSYERQREVFNAGMQNRINSGMTPLEAYEDTKQSIAVPGTSEHATGLAVDIIASGYSELDERQADTPEQQWLMAHCWEYGFILRYPNGTSDVTGIIFEPWHYRYVGKEAAKEITEQGITLEEYLGE